MASTKCIAIATIITPRSNVAGGGRTSLPMPIAAIIRGDPQGLPPPTVATRTISSIMNTTPAIIPAQMAALISSFVNIAALPVLVFTRANGGRCATLDAETIRITLLHATACVQASTNRQSRMIHGPREMRLILVMQRRTPRISKQDSERRLSGIELAAFYGSNWARCCRTDRLIGHPTSLHLLRRSGQSITHQEHPPHVKSLRDAVMTYIPSGSQRSRSFFPSEDATPNARPSNLAVS